MDCKETEQYFADMVEKGEGCVPEKARRHLEHCKKCRELSDAIKGAHNTLETLSGVLAPQKTYLTEKRLNNLLKAAEKEEGKVINFPRGLKWPTAAAAMAAVFILTLYAVLTLPPDHAHEYDRQSGDAAASIRREAEPPETVQPPSFNLVTEFDSTIKTTADWVGTAGREPFIDGSERDNLLSVSSGGVSVPVRESTRLRQDDYWW